MHGFWRTGDDTSYMPSQARKRGRKILDVIVSYYCSAHLKRLTILSSKMDIQLLEMHNIPVHRRARINAYG